MSSWILPPTPELVETAIVPEFYVDGVGAIELVNGCVRVYLFTDQMALESHSNSQKIVCAKLVGPVNNLPRIIGQLATCLYTPDLRAEIGNSKPHIVR